MLVIARLLCDFARFYYPLELFDHQRAHPHCKAAMSARGCMIEKKEGRTLFADQAVITVV